MWNLNLFQLLIFKTMFNCARSLPLALTHSLSLSISSFVQRKNSVCEYDYDTRFLSLIFCAYWVFLTLMCAAHNMHSVYANFTCYIGHQESSYSIHDVCVFGVEWGHVTYLQYRYALTRKMNGFFSLRENWKLKWPHNTHNSYSTR